MTDHESKPADLDSIEVALRELGAETRHQAEWYVPVEHPPVWAHGAPLTDEERAALLARFDETR